jgi:hypothetical protein
MRKNTACDRGWNIAGIKMRESIIVVDDFYADPRLIRDYARSLSYYYPYQPDAAVRSGALRASWMTSWFRSVDECPFKSSPQVIATLERLTGARIDMRNWSLTFPIDREGKADRARLHEPHSCLWNCSFHVKLQNQQEFGEGVHNHVTDSWNAVGANGWAGLVYLDPDAPLDGGLKLWRNRDLRRQFDWMTPKENWELIDDLGNVFNRLLLVRGDIPHSGAAGWGDGLRNGRLFQTFFFTTEASWPPAAVVVPAAVTGER